MGARLRDLAIFVRSKNAGPFMLTIDLFFASAADCEQVLASGQLDERRVAGLFAIDASEVRCLYIPQANALKLSFPRPFPAGDAGDRDVAGGQQFLPLLDLVIGDREDAAA